MAKKALLVGVNDYQQANDLRGCVNDVTNVRNILRTYGGFTNDEIRVLVDKRATKEHTLARLNWLVEAVSPGDHVILHFSGHGSQIRDRDGDELRDHLDELICPHDMNWDDGYITDDMLRQVFDKLPKQVDAEVILDCCHSGTGIKELGLPRSSELGAERTTLNRYLQPPADILCRVEGEEDEVEPTHRFMPTDDRPTRHVLWAGCRDFQTSADAYIEGSFNGAFTYYFCKHLRDAGGNLTRAELLQRVRASLAHNGYSQTPQLECAKKYKNARLFGREDEE
jgi:hypothetical protein